MLTRFYDCHDIIVRKNRLCQKVVSHPDPVCVCVCVCVCVWCVGVCVLLI